MCRSNAGAWNHLFLGIDHLPDQGGSAGLGVSGGGGQHQCGQTDGSTRSEQELARLCQDTLQKGSGSVQFVPES